MFIRICYYCGGGALRFLLLDSLGFFDFGVVMVKVGVVAGHGDVLPTVVGFVGELVFLKELVFFVMAEFILCVEEEEWREDALELFCLLLLRCWFGGSIAFFSSGVFWWGRWWWGWKWGEDKCLVILYRVKSIFVISLLPNPLR